MDQNEPTSPQIDWPNHWGLDPFKDRNYDSSSKAGHWWNQPTHKKVRMGKDASEWEALWGPDAQWVEPKEGYSEALNALRGVQYKISQDSEEHVRSLTRALSTGLVPPTAPDMWKDLWMRDQFADKLVQSRPDTPMRELADAAISHWPWLFAWTGQANQNYKHPVARAVRAGNKDMAIRLLTEINPEDYIDWPGANKDVYFGLRGIWRDSRHWFVQDSSWVKQIVELDPRMLTPHFATGLGPLEQAARDNLPELLRQLLAYGWKPDPEKSFGLTLSHWVINGLSEEKWNAKSQSKEPKTPEEIEDSAERCGQTLSVLQEFGYGMHDPVLKVEKIPGIRRPILPKPKTTAAQMLVEMCEKQKLRPETLAMLEQANMLASTPKPAPSTAKPRSRL